MYPLMLSFFKLVWEDRALWDGISLPRLTIFCWDFYLCVFHDSSRDEAKLTGS